MGINYGNSDSYDPFHYEPFIPIFFAPKIENDKKNILNKKDSISSSSESEASTRKSTLNDEEIEDDKTFKNKESKKLDKFTNIFKKLKNSPIFHSKNEINILDEDDYYLNFDENENIRKNYFSKLIYKNIWTPGEKSKFNNNLSIFDWDDTLFPTSFLVQEDIINDENLPEEYIDIISILEEAIIKVINFALNKGDVYIITNSSIGWVEFSTNKYYPNLKKYLDKIHIISARNEYENAYPGEVRLWKDKTFLSLKNKINLNIPTNIICFGDSIVELEAGKNLASKINNSFIKTIKFKERPEPQYMIKEINLINNRLDYIYSAARNISIKIEKKN